MTVPQHDLLACCLVSLQLITVGTMFYTAELLGGWDAGEGRACCMRWAT